MRVFLLLSLVARAALAADGGSTTIGSNYLNCRVQQSGFDDGGAQFVITVLPLPVDAARASKQPDLGVPGRPSLDVLSVQGVPFGKPVPVKLDSATTGPLQVYGVLSIDDAGVLNVNFPAIQTVNVAKWGGANTKNGQDFMSNSLPVTVAIDQPPIGVYIFDAGAPLNVQGPLTDTQIRATPLPVSGTVALSSTPLPAGASTDSTLSQLLDGGVATLGRQADGTLRPIAVDPSGIVLVNVVGAQTPARGNPLLMPCNAVRSSNCR